MPEDEITVSDKALKELIIDKKLAKLHDPADLMEVLLPCAIALADTVGGKLPQGLNFVQHVKHLLEDEATAEQNQSEGYI